MEKACPMTLAVGWHEPKDSCEVFWVPSQVKSGIGWYVIILPVTIYRRAVSFH
jgi:hypothetical protein